MRPAVEHEPGSSDPTQDSVQGAAESRITEPQGQASFLDAVRTLVHGETIVPPRGDSDSWQPSPEVRQDAAEDSPPEDAVADDVDTWLPGRWVAEDVSPPARPGRRRRTVAAPEKSAKSSRRRRSGRTVDTAARRGAPGAEVQVSRRQHPPDLEPHDQAEPEDVRAEPLPPPEPPIDRRAAKAERRAERKDAKARRKAERELAAHELKLERRASRDAAAAERAATKERAAQRVRDAKEQAFLDRAGALAAKEQAKLERKAAQGRARAERRPAVPREAVVAQTPTEAATTELPERAVAELQAVDRPAVQAQDHAEAERAGGERAAAKLRARADRQAAKAQERAAREAAEEQARLERAAAAAAQAQERADREAAEARAREQARAEREAAKARARADREAAEEQARLERAAAAEAEAEDRARREADAARARADQEAARAQERAAREAAEAQARQERDAAAAAQAEARARAKVQRRHDAARVRAERKAVRAARARDAAERRAEAEQARVDRLAEAALATVTRTKAKSEQAAERATARADAKVAGVTARAERKVERATTRARARAERSAAKAGRRLERAAGKAQSRVDRATARAQARADAAATRAQRAREVDAEVLTWESADTARGEQSLAEHIARVESRRLPARRAGTSRSTVLKVVAVTVVVAACAVVPFVAPSVPRTLADLVPGSSTRTPHVVDPPVEPPSSSVPSSEVTQQVQGLAGVRLQAAGPPREVSVPRLHVDSEVIPISGQSGSLLPPSDPQQLGWWREGQPAGAQYGSAVVTGHTVHTGGGALDHLDKLVVGDSVRVRTDAGWIRYVVERTKVYSTTELARDAKDVFDLGGPGRLVLITCDDWNGVTYESNAVVFAAPVADEPTPGGG